MKIPKISVGSAKSETIKGGGIVSRILAAEGVDTVFGIIDGSYFGLYSTLKPNGIRLITPRHESNAVHMAGAYARLTGKPGVCIASNGPGVANVLAGVALEHAEGNRILLITSTRREGISYPDRGGTFQYFPQVETTRPVTKWSCNVTSHARIAEMVQTALREARLGRPGVVHIDIPENIMSTDYALDPLWFRPPESYQTFEPLPPSESQVETAAEMFLAAELPLIHAGSGVIHGNASLALQEVAALLSSPVSTSWSARAAVDERRKEVIPVIYGDVVSRLRADADVVMVLGSRMGENDGWTGSSSPASAPSRKFIQVDLDPLALGVGGNVDLAVHSDVKSFLLGLIRLLKRIQKVPDHGGRLKRISDYKKRCDTLRIKMDKALDDKNIPIHPARIPSICREVFDNDAIMIIDGGRTAAWAHYFHEIRVPNTVLSASKMGYVGSGSPYAIGAKAAYPDRQVYAVMGDGAMNLNQREIETSIRTDLPVIFVVLCDNGTTPFAPDPFSLSHTREGISHSQGHEPYHWNTRFDLVARAMGASGERVSDPAGLKIALKRAISSRKCTVIHVDVDPEKHQSVLTAIN